MIMKQEGKDYFKIPHNKHLGNKHNEWIVPKNSKTKQLWKALSNVRKKNCFV